MQSSVSGSIIARFRARNIKRLLAPLRRAAIEPQRRAHATKKLAITGRVCNWAQNTSGRPEESQFPSELAGQSVAKVD